jgi:hypothetical protein
MHILTVSIFSLFYVYLLWSLYYIVDSVKYNRDALTDHRRLPSVNGLVIKVSLFVISFGSRHDKNCSILELRGSGPESSQGDSCI